jgi:tetratricopeptide (TPR) repeat protein
MDENDLQERSKFLAEMEAYLGRNELRAVLNLAQARLKKRPGDLEARIALCRAWLLQGRFAESRELFLDMEELLVGFSRAYACLGDICLKRGMEEEAEALYGKFRTLSSEDPPVQAILDRLEGIDKVAQGDEAPEGKEVPPDFRTVTLAELYVRQGHLAQAAEMLDEIVGAEPGNGRAAELLAEVRARLEMEAAEQLRQKVSSELARWLDNIGRLRGHAA